MLLLDEPTTGVDPLSRLEFWDLFEHLPASLRAATGTIVAVIEADPWQRAYAELAARWPGTTLRGTTIRVSLPAGADPRSLLAESLSTIRVERIRATDPSFEDAFIWFIRHSHPSRPDTGRLEPPRLSGPAERGRRLTVDQAVVRRRQEERVMAVRAVPGAERRRGPSRYGSFVTANSSGANCANPASRLLPLTEFAARCRRRADRTGSHRQGLTVSSGTWSWCRSPRDGPCLASQPRGLPHPAGLHTDGAFPPFSRASSPQKLASPTFQVPFWYTATPD